MIFIDSNIPMYLVGNDSSRKYETRMALDRLARERARLVTSSEVFQEILHRYVSIKRRVAIEGAFVALEGIVDEVLPIDRQDVVNAKAIVQAITTASARDALHVSIMRRYGIGGVLSYDRGFDAFPGITRIRH